MGAVIDVVGPVLTVLNGLSLPVKAAWVVWLAWGLAQLAWYAWTRERSSDERFATPVARDSETRPVVRPPAVKKAPVAAAVAPYGTSDFLAALDQEQAAMAAHGARDSASAYR